MLRPDDPGLDAKTARGLNACQAEVDGAMFVRERRRPAGMTGLLSVASDR